MTGRWTPERRARQAELIQTWQPWKESTGPRTAAGKARSSRNAYKGAWRKKLRRLASLLRELQADQQARPNETSNTPTSSNFKRD